MLCYNATNAYATIATIDTIMETRRLHAVITENKIDICRGICPIKSV